MKKSTGIFLLCMTLILEISAQGPILFPDDAVVNILTYGENLNDGITNATPAILQAIDEHDGDLFTRRILYFPAGTYLVEESIVVDAISASGNGTGKSIVFQGAGSAFLIKDAKKGGIWNSQNILSVRKLTTENIVGPAVWNAAEDGFVKAKKPMHW